MFCFFCLRQLFSDAIGGKKYADSLTIRTFESVKNTEENKHF